MARPPRGARTWFITLMLVLGVMLSSLPILDLPAAIGNSSSQDGSAPAQTASAAKKNHKGKTKKQRKNKKNKKSRNKKSKKNKRQDKKARKKRKGNRETPPALDAKVIAAENQQAARDLSTCAGLERVPLDGQDICTHGEDPHSFSRAASPGAAGMESVAGGMSTSSALCIGDGQDGPRVQLVYVHANNQPNRLGNLLPTFRRLASEMDTILDQSARKTNGTLRIRFVTNAQCQVEIPAVSVPAGSLSGFGPVINELKSRGYNALNRKYLMLVDSNVYCGVGQFDGGRDADKPDTSLHDTIGFARIDIPCWDAGTMLHELSHTLGAVQYSAPHSSKGAHCIDEWDVMCYSDAPYKPKMQILCDDGRQDFRLDCGNDDYFAANPAPDSYLATHWNMANSMYFIDVDGPQCVDAATEPDDAYWYAFWEVPMPRMTVGASEQHAFCSEPGDTDWLLFTGEPGATYEITTSDLGPDVDTQLVVYRGFAEQGWGGMDRIASNDDRAPDDVSSQIAFTAPAAGSYLIGVSDANSRAGYDANYTISLQAIPTTGASELQLSRPRLRTKGKFTATMTGVAPFATVQFQLERNNRTRFLGTAEANEAGVASALLSIPKGARPGRYMVEGSSSDGSSSSAPIKVNKDGGRRDKGGKKKRNKPVKHRKKHRNKR